MVRASKTSTAEKQTVVTPVVENTAVKTVRTKKTKPVVETVPTTLVAPVVSEPTVAPLAVDTTSDVITLSVKMTEFSAKLQQMMSVFSAVKNDFKTLEKTVSRELKNAQKASTKRRRASGNRQPSGFVKPTLISDELAQFLGKEIGTEMARTAVSKEINAYIRANSLQDAANGRQINPDNKLSTLLKYQQGDVLTYFNLQKYMKHHFIKTTPVATA